MNKIRVLIQQKLEEIQDLEVSAEIPDTMLEKNKTYFSFNLQKDYVDGDFDRNYTYRISLTGYIKRLLDTEENTLEIVDNITNEIENKLKQLNIKTSFQDITGLDGICKNLVKGNVIFNEINKELV